MHDLTARRIFLSATIAFWLYYWAVQKLVGPVGPDELYFAHTFWLIEQGQRQFIDFYSQHLPTYFWLLSPLIGNDLTFIYWLRATEIIVIAAYLAMTRPVVWPFVLLFAVLARMTEIRTDTFGLVLVNAGWFLLLKGKAVPGAAIASLALLFSARSALILPVFGIACLALADGGATIRRLFYIAAAWAAAITLTAALAWDWLTMVFLAVYVTPSQAIPSVPILIRFFTPDRLVLTALIFAALAFSLITWRRQRANKNALVVAIATAGQLLMVALDPAPYQYVYGWCMIPTVAGLLMVGAIVNIRLHILLPSLAAAAAVGIVAGWLAFYDTDAGRPNTLRLTVDRPFANVQRWPTERLVSTLLTPQAPWNTIAAREELCRRISGPALAYFWYQPVCLRDATYDWVGISWTVGGIEKLAAARKPALLLWGTHPYKPTVLPPGYIVRDGYALRPQKARGQ